MIRTLVFSLSLLLGFTLGTPCNAQAEHWKGTIEIPGASIDFLVSFTPSDEGGHSATLTIPIQGIKNAPLRDVSYSDEHAAFTLGGMGMGNAEFRLEFETPPEGAAPTRATGTLKQMGREFPISAERVDDPSAIESKRPQTPRPPFPYETRDVAFENPDAEGVTLAGTLTIPEGDGPFPALVTITGSGPQDRDETIFDHKPFLVIADHLTRRGIAVLRYDDRGTGESTGDFSQAGISDFASDASAAVEFLRTQPGIDPEQVGLLGHSEGGLVGPMTASMNDNVAFLVLLAPTAVPGDEVLVAQTELLLRRQGATEEQVARRTKAFRAALDAVKRGAPIEELIPHARRMLAVDAEISGQEMVVNDAVVTQTAAGMSSPWMRDFITLDPATYVEQLEIPVLALFGSLDVQVTPRQNAGPMRGALEDAPTENWRVEVVEGVNHLFQPAETGGVDEYQRIEQTIRPDVLDTITEWLRSRTR